MIDFSTPSSSFDLKPDWNKPIEQPKTDTKVTNRPKDGIKERDEVEYRDGKPFRKVKK